MAERTCSIEGCEKPHFGLGWCKMHHRRWERHGDPTKVFWITDPVERFWANVIQRGSNECWTWTGRTHEKGYGEISVGGRLKRAHRFAYELLVAPIPDGYSLDHICHDVQACTGGITCPHRRCCNPEHLVPVPPAVNNTRGRCVSVNRLKTHCPRGHEYTPENTIVYKSGSRACRACRPITQALYDAKRRSANGLDNPKIRR